MAAASSFIDDGTTEQRSHNGRSRRPYTTSGQHMTPGTARACSYENYNVEIDDGLGWDDVSQEDAQSFSSVSTRMSTAMTVVDIPSTVEVPTSPALAHYRIKGLVDITPPQGALASAQFVIRGKYGERVVVEQKSRQTGPKSAKVDKPMLTSQDKTTAMKAKRSERTQHQMLDPMMLSAGTKWQDELWRSRQQPSIYSLHKHKKSSTGSKMTAERAEEEELKSTESSAFSLTKHTHECHAENKKSRSASKASSSTFSLGKHALQHSFSDNKGPRSILETPAGHKSPSDKKQDKQSSDSSSTFSMTRHTFHQVAEDHNHHKYFSMKKSSGASKNSSSLNHLEAQTPASKVPSSIIWFAGGPLNLPTKRSVSTNIDTKQPSNRSATERRVYTVSRTSHGNNRSSTGKQSPPSFPVLDHGNDVRLDQDWTRCHHELEQLAGSATIYQDPDQSQILDLGWPSDDHESVPVSQIRPDLFYKDWPPMQYQEELDHAKDVARLKSNRKMAPNPKLSGNSKSTAGNAMGWKSERPARTLEQTKQWNLLLAQRLGARREPTLHDQEATPEDLDILANYLTSIRPDVQDDWKIKGDGTATSLLYNDPNYRQHEAIRQTQARKERRGNQSLDTASLKTLQPGDSASQLSPIMTSALKNSMKPIGHDRDSVSENKKKQLYPESRPSYRAPTVEDYEFDRRSETRTTKRNVVVSYRRGHAGQHKPLEPGDENLEANLVDWDVRSEWIRKTIDRAPKATITTYAALPRMEAEVDSLKSSSRRTRSSGRQPTPLRSTRSFGVEADGPKKEIVARWDIVEVLRQVSSSDTGKQAAGRVSASQRSKQSLCDVVEVIEEVSTRSEIPSDRHIVTKDPTKRREDSAGRRVADASGDVVEGLAPGERSSASWENRRATIVKTRDEIEAEQTYAWRDAAETGSKARDTASWGPVKSHSQHAAGYALSKAASKKSAQSRASHATQRTETPSRKVVGWDDGVDREISHYDHASPEYVWRGSASGLSQDSKAMTQAPGKKVIGWDDGVIGPARVD